MTIRLLPAALVNQIAAGEVVERPASVVKELIENALDAGATRISIRIEGGGRDLIEVADDGGGIAREELSLALAAHATSKIAASDDLNRICTFGFRGEALSAIAAVAHVTMTSCVAGATQAWSIDSRFGEVSAFKPAAGGRGTRLEVRGLFTNVPARRNFLRGLPAEAARVTEVVCNAALANPSVAFRLESAARKVFDLACAGDAVGRVADVLGEALGREPLTVIGEATGDDGLRAIITGSICRPESMRSVSRTQRLFVNGRPIIDRSLMHAVREAYRGLADPALQPVFVLFLQVDPGSVDVNVHPQKSEVRWRSPSAMHRLVYRAVQDTLRLADLTAAGSGLLGGSSPPTPYERTHTREVLATDRPSGAPNGPPALTALCDEPIGEHQQPTLLSAPVHTPDVLQINSTWLVFAEDGALVIVDQHALHERMMFQEIRARIGAGDLMTQQLLVPATADVPPEALARLEVLAPLFARLGIEAVAAGPRSIAVHAFPVFLAGRGVQAATFVARALTNDQLASACESNDSAALRESAISDVLDMMACKAAIKGGDRLSQAEIARLLAARSETDRATNCPHGRPTSVRIPLADIERRFGRR
ncbi:MAG: DNA mismatch repair endonuclease MutL [Phycisphaerales bacterium]|nr:DNA mismatch repair endonuclease MutL [Phycisphaerales bacterium]